MNSSPLDWELLEKLGFHLICCIFSTKHNIWHNSYIILKGNR